MICIVCHANKLVELYKLHNTPPSHLLGSHTVLGVSVPVGLNFTLFMAYSFPINPLIPVIPIPILILTYCEP